MICLTCPRTTDGAAQCDRCLLRRAQQLHRLPSRPPVLLTEAEQQKGELDRKARRELRATEQRAKYTPKTPRKPAVRRQNNGRLSVGDTVGGWVVMEVIHGGTYRVRCPLCPAETNKNRTMMGRHSACRSCANKQGKRGSVTR